MSVLRREYLSARKMRFGRFPSCVLDDCIDVIESAFSKEDVKAFCLIDAFKYVWRSKTHKDCSDVNVRKAIWFLERSLNHE
jgi:hypothetical protein